MDQSQIRHDSLANKVFAIVRNAIIFGDLAPGSLHSVQEIAEKLKISRTPVREALLKLEEQGMVAFERNRGARILETTVHDLEEIFNLRVLLEVPSAYKAAKRATQADIKKLRQTLEDVESAYRTTSPNVRAHLEPDARFHRAIALISGSRRLAGILDNLFDQQMIANGTSGGYTRGMAEISVDHKRIFDAIAAQDPPAAAKAMRDHLIVSLRAIVAKETGDADANSAFDLLYPDFISMNIG